MSDGAPDMTRSRSPGAREAAGLYIERTADSRHAPKRLPFR